MGFTGKRQGKGRGRCGPWQGRAGEGGLRVRGGIPPKMAITAGGRHPGGTRSFDASGITLWGARQSGEGKAKEKGRKGIAGHSSQEKEQGVQGTEDTGGGGLTRLDATGDRPQDCGVSGSVEAAAAI